MSRLVATQLTAHQKANLFSQSGKFTTRQFVDHPRLRRVGQNLEENKANRERDECYQKCVKQLNSGMINSHQYELCTQQCKMIQ
jgi:hypothetical protein